MVSSVLAAALFVAAASARTLRITHSDVEVSTAELLGCSVDGAPFARAQPLAQRAPHIQNSPPRPAACPILTPVSFVAGIVNNADTPINVTSLSGRAAFPHDGVSAFEMPTKRVLGGSIEPGAELSLEYPWQAASMHADYKTLRITAEVNFEVGAKKYRATLYNDTVTFAPRAASAASSAGFIIARAIMGFALLCVLAYLPFACATDPDAPAWTYSAPAGAAAAGGAAASSSSVASSAATDAEEIPSILLAKKKGSKKAN